MYEELIEIRKIRDQEEKLVPVGLKIIATYEKIYNKQKDCFTLLEKIKGDMGGLNTQFEFL